MPRSFPILLCCSLLAAAALINAAHAHVAFPTVADIEASFHFYPGAQLPRDVQARDGVIYHTYYVKGKELGGGYYDVTVKLDR